MLAPDGRCCSSAYIAYSLPDMYVVDKGIGSEEVKTIAMWVEVGYYLSKIIGSCHPLSPSVKTQ